MNVQNPNHAAKEKANMSVNNDARSGIRIPGISSHFLRERRMTKDRLVVISNAGHARRTPVQEITPEDQLIRLTSQSEIAGKTSSTSILIVSVIKKGMTPL